jgi:long-chain acyl-CoA synthetase
MSDAQSIPAAVLDNAKNRSAKPAMREKYHGVWQTYSWAAYEAEVRKFALGLKALGFGPGDKLSVIGDNRPGLYWAQIAAQALGGAAVPVFQDAIASELAYVLADADISFIAAEDQEQVDKVLSIKDQLPALKGVIYNDGRGLGDYDEPLLKSFEEVQKIGESGDGAAYEASIRDITADTVAYMCYTSGTTGRPKGVMLTHGNMLSTGKAFVANEDVRESDDFLSYLPMAWVGDATYSVVTSVLTGAATNCPESPETLQRDLRELGPTGMIAAPRVWEGILSEIQVKAEDLSGVKRLVFNKFRDAAIEYRRKEEVGESHSAGDKLMQLLGEYLVYAPVRDQFGLRRARWCLTGGAPLGPDTFRFFRAFGINLKQVYGSTELSGLASLQSDTKANPDTVGKACDGIDLRIAENGEVLVKSAGVFKGYYKNEVATADAFVDGDWFKTGDAGLIGDDGELTIIDRAKDVGQLTDGSAFAPQFVENKLKYSAYISEAISFGHDRPHVCAMVAIDFNTVGKWAERKALPYTNYMDLAQKDEVRDLIGEEVKRINATLPDALQVKRFLLLGKDFDADDAEVTRTRKLRRSYIAEHYAPVINAFYGGQDTVDLRAEVTFEDGRKSHVDMRLSIQDAA